MVSVPQFKWMWSYLDDMAHHKRRYSKRELKAKLKEAGFEITYLTSFVFSLFPLMAASRILKGKKNVDYDVDKQMKELELGKLSNKLLGAFMRIDELLINAGLRLPFGGSLVVVAKKKVDAV